jgi:hypothetical protein
MKIIGEKGLLEVNLANFVNQGTPGECDVLLNVTAQVWSYSAADQSWVVGDAWCRFLAELGTLEERRQGSAVLEGASPDDLRLEFYSTDSVGHMAVKGHLGQHKTDGNVLMFQFHLSFEPDLLPEVVRTLRAFRS